MKNEKEERGLQDRISTITISFTEVYIILISIIQATVFGYLIMKFFENYYDLTPLKILISLATFLLIIMVWNQYMMSSTVLIFKPRLFPDSILIFVLGFTETLVIYHIFSDLYLWCYAMALITFVILLTTINGFHNAKQNSANDIIFQKLGYWPKLIQIMLFVISIIYVILGYVSSQYANIQTIQYFIASFFLIITVIYLAGGFKYWTILRSTPQNN